MDIIRQIHGFFGERVLPLLIVLAAIYFVITWKPEGRRDIVTRLFPVLVGLQVLLGLILAVYLLVAGGAARVLSFPFVLHPIIGLLAAGVAQVSTRPNGPLRRLGRWSPLVVLALLLIMVIGNVMLARRT
jgi:hypothetical protein